MTLKKTPIASSSSPSSSTTTTTTVRPNNNNNNNNTNNGKILSYDDDDDSLLTFRAASLLSQQLLSTFTKERQQQQQQSEAGEEEEEEGHSLSSSIRRTSSIRRRRRKRGLRDVVGDFGSVLFNPLDEDILLMDLLVEEEEETAAATATAAAATEPVVLVEYDENDENDHDDVVVSSSHPLHHHSLLLPSSSSLYKSPCKSQMISQCKPEIFMSGSSTAATTVTTTTTTTTRSTTFCDDGGGGAGGGAGGGCDDKVSLQESSTSEDSTEYQQELSFTSTIIIDQQEGRRRNKTTSNNILETNNTYPQQQQYIFDHEVFPVQIELPDDPLEYIEAPPILNTESLQEIVDRALPRNLRIYKWKRIFSIAKDGDLFFTMLEQCSSFKHTLMVCRTTHGHILGGFASEKWEDQDGYDRRHSYFGTGTCFLFSTHPRPTTQPSSPRDDVNDDDDTTTIPDHNRSHDHRFSFYKWSGMNDYCQICDTDKGQIAMGGGSGDFGLVIEDGFFRGTSGHCATFNNPPLIPGIDGTFEILDFEVYGLLPLLPTVSKLSSTTTASDSFRSSSSQNSGSKKYSPRSLLGRSPFY